MTIITFLLLLLPFAILLAAGGQLLRWTRSVTVYEGSHTLQFRDGKLERMLEPGRHRYFDPFGRVEIVRYSAEKFAAQGQAIDVLTKDRFSARVMLTPMCKMHSPQDHARAYPPVTSPVAARMAAAAVFAGKNPQQPRTDNLATFIAASAIAHTATMTLEELIANTSLLANQVLEDVRHQVPGVIVETISLSSLTVPPEVRKMFTEVERARLDGLAQVERARGEQAALRALANAARTLNGNPQLVQLRLLQTMESARGAKTFVMGQLNDELVETAGASAKK